MTFEELFDHAIAMLQRRGRITYRALQRQFALGEEALNDLKDELLYAYPEVHDDAGRGLVWTGDAGTASLDDHRRLGRVSAYLSNYFCTTGDQDRAVETGQRALAIAMASKDFTLEVMATFFLGLSYLSLGDYRQAVHYHKKNVEILRGEWLHERFGEAGLPSVFSRAFLTWSLAELGEFAEGIVRGEEAVQIAETTVDQPFTLSHAYLGVGLLHLRKGDLPQAIAMLERSLRVCQAGDIQLVLPWAASALGYAYALSGHLAEALPLLEQAVEQSAAAKYMNFYPLLVAHLGEAYLLAGRIEDASQQARHALERSRDLKQRGHEAYALRLLGEIAAQRQPPDAEAAAAAYRQAMTLADELGMRPLVAHCHLGLGTSVSRLDTGIESKPAPNSLLPWRCTAPWT